jgi:hypothetical protein
MVALIGRLPATLEDRAIVLPMRRRAPGEAVDRMRRDGLLRQGDPLRRRTARWVAEHLPALRAADPAVPAELEDRQADNWRPLLAIADEAGGAWPDLARTAARRLAGAVAEADTAAPVQLLADLRELFTTTMANRLATAAIIRHLAALGDRPWVDYAQGQPLTPRHLATLLEGFRIRAKQIRQGAATRKGYMRADFTDAFSRYLPPDPKHPNRGTRWPSIPTGSRRQEWFRGRRPPRREPPQCFDVSDAPPPRSAGERGGTREPLMGQWRRHCVRGEVRACRRSGPLSPSRTPRSWPDRSITRAGSTKRSMTAGGW